MIQAACSQVKKYYGVQLVLENITFEVQDGERVAIIGKNGSGKSTILKLITRQESPDAGTVSIRKNTVTGYLEQIPEYEEGMTVSQVCRLAFEKLDGIREEMTVLEKRMEELTYKGTLSEEETDRLEAILKRYTNLQTQYETEGGYETEERFSRICTGLKLSESFLKAEFGRLSGGEKTLVCLAKTLLQEPDLLILDEPASGIDQNGMAKFYRTIYDYKNNHDLAIILISHDLEYVAEYADEVILLDTRILKDGPPAKVFESEEFRSVFGSVRYPLEQEGAK